MSNFTQQTLQFGHMSASSMSLTATGSVAVNTSDAGTVAIQVTGTWVGTLVFEATNDATLTTWNSVNAYPLNSGTPVTSATANGNWKVDVAGFRQFRVRCSTFSSGPIQIDMGISKARFDLSANAGVASGTVAISQATPGTTNLVQTPPSKNIRINPTITAGAYSSGQVVGGKLTLTNAVGSFSLACLLESLFIKCKSNITPAFTIYFFDTNPSNGTYTDNASLTWNATDFAMLIGQVSVVASQWKANNSKQTVDIQAIGKELVSTSTSIYALIVADGAFTPTGTTDLTFDFNLLQE